MMLATVFPGQGAQRPDMGFDLCSRFDTARRTYEQASEILGFDLVEASADAGGELSDTRVVQPAVFTHGMACWNVIRELGAESPRVVAGHSLGEITAFCAAGALTFADAVAVVQKRSEIMADAVPGTGTIVVLGSDPSTVATVLDAVPDELGVVTVANRNSPDQVVLSGHLTALDEAQQRLEAEGAAVKRLRISVAVHTPLLAKAVPDLASVIDSIRVSEPKIDVVSSIFATVCRRPEDVTSSILGQLTKPVDWPATLDALADLGVTRLLEIGATPTLTNLTRDQRNDMTVTSCTTAADVAATSPEQPDVAFDAQLCREHLKAFLRLSAATPSKRLVDPVEASRSTAELWGLLDTVNDDGEVRSHEAVVRRAEHLTDSLLQAKGVPDGERSRLMSAATDEARARSR